MNHYGELFKVLSTPTLSYCITGLIIALLGLYVSFKANNLKYTSLWLFIAVAIFGFGFIQIDDFLCPWDEQFHALVAKNLLADPLTPRLLNGPVKFPFDEWIWSDIWLHKQPLFLWQMALSMKLFGVNLIALRLPSLILHALTTVLVLSIAKRYLTLFFALLAAILYGFSGYLNDFVSGAVGMEHNDVAFMFYVTASFWAWLRYKEQPVVKRALLIGVFAGAAILTKWLVGLVVFSGWGMCILIFQRNELKAWKHLFMAVGIAILIVLPWQLYCLIQFPESYLFELNYNSRHFTEVLEGHSGTWTTYIESMNDIFGRGDLTQVFVLSGWLLAIYMVWKKKEAKWVFAWVVFTAVYVFFTLAATKLAGYTLVVACYGFIFFLLPFQLLVEQIKRYKPIRLHPILLTSIVLTLFVLRFYPQGVLQRHYFDRLENRAFYESAIDLSIQQVNSHPGYRVYYLKNSPNYHIPAVRFATDEIVYPYYEGQTNMPNSIVLDVGDIYTHMQKRWERKEGTIWK